MNRKIRIESKLVNLRVVENAIDEVNSQIGINEENYGKILVSTLEAVHNAILHGNNSNPDKFVEIELKFIYNKLLIKVIDEGTGFCPDQVPDPTMPVNREEPNGRGIFLMSRLADKIKYSKKGNAVTLTFKNIIF